MTTPTCLICQRSRAVECSHVDCPNRKPITAQLPSGQSHEMVPSMVSKTAKGYVSVGGGATRRDTRYRE